jgi:16S rRNA (guanine527-N7)-methyltransferase
VAFITHAAVALGLQNLTAVHRRVQDMAAEPFDIIASRAFASLADFLASTRSLLKDGGIWLAMKGKPPIAEMAALSNVEFHVEPVIVPGLDADRCLIWVRPKIQE